MGNKIDAAIDFDSRSEDDEEVSVSIIMDQTSAQLVVLRDGTYFADIHVDERMVLDISYSDLWSKTNRGKAMKIDLRRMLEKIEDLLAAGVDLEDCELSFVKKSGDVISCSKCGYKTVSYHG